MFVVPISKTGRIVVPVALRRRLELDGRRADLLFRVSQGQVTLTTRTGALRAAQDRVSELATPSNLLASDELIRERRLAARRESDDG